MFLLSISLILLLGFGGGQLAKIIGLPPLLGMMLVGICLGSEVSNAIAPELLNLADELRMIAVIIILIRAGLGLDRDKLRKQSSVAIRLGFLPAIAEMLVVAIVAMWLLQFDFVTGLLLGIIISAESPAVIVPGMLRLKNLGFGVVKGIPDAILTGSALSDVLVLLLFSLLLSFLERTELTSAALTSSDLWLVPFNVILQIVMGIVIGYLVAKVLVWVITKSKSIAHRVQITLIVICCAFLVVVGSSQFPFFSGYLAAMALGFFIIEFSPPLARKLRIEFSHLWIVAEIILFVLMGAAIQLQTLKSIILPGLMVLGIGLFLGRSLGWYFATLGSNWSWREKLFLLPGNSAKATVQAAIGALPLSLGLPGGDKILAIAALSILVTAPLGAWAIPTFAPKLLSKDQIDPTKTAIANKTIFLAVITDYNLITNVLAKTADLARRADGEILLVQSQNYFSNVEVNQFKKLTNQILLDIPYQFLNPNSYSVADIIALAEAHQVTGIVLGKQEQPSSESYLLGSVAHALLSNSNIPVILIGD